MATETAAPARPGIPPSRSSATGSTSAASGSSRRADDTIEVIDSTTEEVIGRIPQGTPEDVDRAVAAARAGFEAWSQVPVEQRVDALRGDQRRRSPSAPTRSRRWSPREVGMPIGAGADDPGRAADDGLRLDGPGLLDEVAWEEQIGNSLIVREPVGVVGCITPWNYPLHQICAKVAPALAAGCTVVVKPSEVTPLNAFILAEIIDAARRCRPGVFNLVTGFGPVVGEAIAAHAGVDMVSFTGSTRAGRRVSEVAARAPSSASRSSSAASRRT